MTALLERASTTIGDVIRSIPGAEAYIRHIQQEAAAAEYAERLQLAKDIKQLEAADLAAVRQHDREAALLDARVAGLERQLATAREDRARLYRARRADSFVTSGRLDKLRHRLEALAPREAVEAFVVEMQGTLEGQRLQADEARELAIDGEYYVRWSNRDSLIRRSEAILAAITAARALRGEALDGPAIESRLDALRESIPVVEQRPAKYYRIPPDGDAG